MQIYGLFFFFARFFLFFLLTSRSRGAGKVSEEPIPSPKHSEDFEKRQMSLGLRQSADAALDFLSDLLNLEARLKVLSVNLYNVLRK